MSNIDRDKAKNAFTPETFFSDVIADMALPVDITSGDAAIGYNIVGISTNTLVDVTSYSVHIYIWDEDVWKLMESNDNLTAAFNETYFIAPWNRFYAQVLNISGSPSAALRLRRNYTV